MRRYLKELLISGLTLVVLLSLCAYALLLGHSGQASVSLEVDPNAYSTGGAAIAFPQVVYRFESNTLVQAGNLLDRSPDFRRIDLTLFKESGAFPESLHGGFVVPCTFNALWQTRDEEDQERVRQYIKDLFQEFMGSLSTLYTSEVFTVHYAPRLKERLKNATDRTFKDPEVEKAVSAALQGFGSELQEELSDILPTLWGTGLEELGTSMAEGLKSLIDKDDPERQKFMPSLMKALTEDEKVQQAFRTSLEASMDKPEMGVAMEQVLTRFRAEVAADEEFMRLLESLAKDPGLGPVIEPFVDKTVHTTKAVARIFLFEEDEANPDSWIEALDPYFSLFVRLFIAGNQDSFLLLANEEEYQRLTRLNFPAYRKAATP